ncbi:MAG: lytic transglycosylase domain-containing protein [Anaerovoracaceae bacterium]
MTVDMLNLMKQYGVGSADNQNTSSSSYRSTDAVDFNTTLNKILSGNRTLHSLEELYRNSSKTGGITTGSELEAIFQRAAATYDVPVELLKAVGKAESNFNPDATSSCGAMGIMQLMPATAKALGVTDAYDPEQNIMGGAKYLSDKLKAYDGDITLALAAYNAGPGNVAKYGGVPPFKETRNYIKKIYGYMGEDIQLPGSITSEKSAYAASSSKALSDISDLLKISDAYNSALSEMTSEKAYFTAQLQILKQQLDMQQIFADSSTYDDDDDDNSLDINLMIDALSRL